MLVSTRMVIGLIVPAALCFMAYRAAAIHSTQSSTGILFPTMIVLFMSEMIGAALIRGFSGLYF